MKIMGYKIRKQWKQPNFIVLVRIKKQEAVLAVCKLYSNSDGPENVSFSGCGEANPFDFCYDDALS